MGRRTDRAVLIEWILILVGLGLLVPWPFVRSSLGHTPSWYGAVLVGDLVAMAVIALRRLKRMRDVWR
jgi:hypothetical protein